MVANWKGNEGETYHHIEHASLYAGRETVLVGYPNSPQPNNTSLEAKAISNFPPSSPAPQRGEKGEADKLPFCLLGSLLSLEKLKLTLTEKFLPCLLLLCFLSFTYMVPLAGQPWRRKTSEEEKKKGPCYFYYSFRF